MTPSLKPLLLVSLALMLLLLTAGCVSESRIGKVVPCSNYHTIAEKHIALDESGNRLFIVSTTDGGIYAIIGYSILWYNEDSAYSEWNQINIGSTGHFIAASRYDPRVVYWFVKENVTRLNTGENFCEVTP